LADSRVLIREADYGGETIHRVVDELFDAFAIDPSGKKVLVKPNMLSARPPARGVTTHPEVVSAVVAALERRGAAEIWVGDNPGMRHYGDSEEAADKTGIRAAAGKYYRHLGRQPRRVRIHNPYAPEVTVAGEALDCDMLISLPKFKTHALTMLTCAVKNSYGFLLGAEKAHLHRTASSPSAFARTVVDVWAIRPPDFVIVDAVTAMQGNGPSSLDVFHYGRLMASTDSVALDAVVGSLMGLSHATVLTTVEAASRGFGSADLAKIEIDGPHDPIAGFKLPSTARGSARNGIIVFLAGLVSGLIVSQPHADTNACVRCGLCAEHCPTDAVVLDPFPRIDRGKCIRCYCCLEFCPCEAMKLSKRVRLLRKLGR
jgi:uncharacterized protein (DUF362 family)/NAD-dependent dihydropyrimidine dehydrogenase PreA subunit